MPPLPEPPASELEALVESCLGAADPAAELDRRTAGNPQLRAAAWQVLQQVLRLERGDPTDIGQSSGAAAVDPSWPSIPGIVRSVTSRSYLAPALTCASAVSPSGASLTA